MKSWLPAYKSSALPGVVGLAVHIVVSDETGGVSVQRQLAHAAAQARLVPGKTVDAQQETVGDDPAAARAALPAAYQVADEGVRASVRREGRGYRGDCRGEAGAGGRDAHTLELRK